MQQKKDEFILTHKIGTFSFTRSQQQHLLGKLGKRIHMVIEVLKLKLPERERYSEHNNNKQRYLDIIEQIETCKAKLKELIVVPRHLNDTNNSPEELDSALTHP